MPRYLKCIWLVLTFSMCAFPDICRCQQQDNADAMLWYKRCIVYSLDVATFMDSDGDGKGDFKGLTQRLGYFDSLGINALWLSPFFPSPGLDDGYDISDFYGINPELGTMQDFENFVRAAHKRNIYVLADLVINHTSDKHPWFTKAREKDPEYFGWYVWAADRPKDASKGMVFPGVQKETWTYDTTARMYFFHRFYKFQPDLNFTNPKVQKEAFAIARYWIRQGMDGYRLDAVPFIIDVPETGSDKPQRMLPLIADFQKVVKKEKETAILLGEANLSPEENKDYFGEGGNGLQVMFNFYANQYLFYSMARGKSKTLVRALERTRQKPETAQWAFFLRNHDEVDLGRLSKAQRKLVYEQFGPDSSMQLYDRGIRRRLAPMLHGDPARIKLCYSLLFSLPGTPVLRYGEEIGMGDDLHLKERLSVRTPMQWSDSKNGGFSDADSLFRPVISSGPYGFKEINVRRQQADASSLWQFTNTLIRLRKQLPEISNGEYEIIKTSSPAIFAIKYRLKGKDLVIIHNLSGGQQGFKLKGKKYKRFESLMTGYPAMEDQNHVSLEGYGFGWYYASEA